jgi:LacI family transcriptional regulator
MDPAQNEIMTPPERSERPTLKTISQLSGFAVPTVSRALKDAPDIGKSTRETVQRIAREIGYVPNRAGVRLKTGRTNVISLVLSSDHDMMNHTTRLISAIAGELRDTDYQLIITPYFANEEPMKPVKYIVESGSADAVILNQTKPDVARITYLLDRNFPFATYGRTSASDQHAYFDFDNEKFGRYAIRTLANRGRRNILLIAPPRNHNYAHLMITGATDAASNLGVDLSILEAATSDDRTGVIQSAATEYLRRNPTLDGILSASTAAALASVAAIEAMNRTVAEDVERAGAFLAKATIQAINQPDLPPMQDLDFPLEKNEPT